MFFFKQKYISGVIAYKMFLSCRGRSRKNFEPAGDSNEAQKKFAGATAISSDQFFGPRDPDVSYVHITPKKQDLITVIEHFAKSMMGSRIYNMLYLYSNVFFSLKQNRTFPNSTVKIPSRVLSSSEMDLRLNREATMVAQAQTYRRSRTESDKV